MVVGEFVHSVWTDKPQSPQGLKTVSVQYQRALKGSGTNFWKHPRGFFLQLGRLLRVCRPDFTATVTSVNENTQRGRIQDTEVYRARRAEM